MIEKDHRFYAGTPLTNPTFEMKDSGRTYLAESEQVPLVEDAGHDRSQNQASESGIPAQFHSLLPLPCASKDAGHDEDDVRGGGDEVDLEDEVPPSVPVAEWRCVEKIDVTRAEDDDIEDLGKEGNTCGRGQSQR